MAFEISELVAQPNFAPKPWQSVAPDPLGGHRPAVTGSPDLARVLALARRPAFDAAAPEAAALARAVTARLRRDPQPLVCTCRSEHKSDCMRDLREVQAAALYDLALCSGALHPIGVGHGKTLLDLLAPLVVPNCRVALLLIPPTLVGQLVNEYRLLSQHFVVPALVTHATVEYTDLEPSTRGLPVLHVLPYSRLSRPEATTWIEGLGPDLIIADECDKLRDPGTATTSRVLRYFRAHPEARFAGWTGSLTESSVEDYAHLAALALREGSPLPIDPEVAKEWATALDPDGRPAPAGALLALCDPGEHVADGFHRRLVETSGVIATDTSAVECALAIEERDPGMIPHEIERLLLDLRATWTRPDGEELVDAMAVAACARQLASGFYYRWRFPRGETVEQILLWLEARKSWHRELRDKLRDRSEHLDSPLLCTRAARRAWGDEPIVEAEWVEVECYGDDGLPLYDAEGRPVTRRERQRSGNAHLPRWKADSWPKWRDVRGTVAPETEAVLVDDYLARDAAAWAVEHRGIVWYEHGAFGRWVADIGGLALHGGGAGAGEAIAAEDGSRSIVCSIHAHGRGRDGLQKIFSEQLVANPPSSASRWEQLLGRLHRIRQKAPVVSTWFYRHTEETAAHVSKALARALYVQRTLGATQKLRVGFNL